ncbi:hypothetical protein D9758_007253 [Tetrapyrgos nigripes]|uniref:Uncharacterized protein n=1 Tax=Tetrapyrgos nigripes TaxID=182062 RepID=A0A8H5D1Q7_9AGAR|nr:hypothetical protein D9758_007253 [Tetrapyrgos nigripes]
MSLLNRQDDPQTALTLDPEIVGSGFVNDGQDQPVAGQVASLTSTNNFINFCLTVPNLPITNGKQIESGSCNPTPMGQLPSVDNIPSTKFKFPANGDSVDANAPFTIQLAVQNMDTGFHTNEQENFLSAPQVLNGEGLVSGYCTVVIEELTDLAQTTPTNPKQFAYWHAITGSAQDGMLEADVVNGLPSGTYRITATVYNMNHHPVVLSIEQHGMMGDAVYFIVSEPGRSTITLTSTSSPTSTSISSTETSSISHPGTETSTPNFGAIAGGVVAALVSIALIFLLWLLWRRGFQIKTIWGNDDPTGTTNDQPVLSSSQSRRITQLSPIISKLFFFKRDTTRVPIPDMVNANTAGLSPTTSRHPGPTYYARPSSNWTVFSDSETLDGTGRSSTRAVLGSSTTSDDIEILKLKDKVLSRRPSPSVIPPVPLTPPSARDVFSSTESDRPPSWSSAPSYHTEP